jgi:hypothetical protein
MPTGRRCWTGVVTGAVFVLAFSCKKKPPEPSCDERVRALESWMQALGSEGASVPRATLVTLDEPPRAGIDGSDIELDAGRVTISGGLSASTSDPATLVNELNTWRNAVDNVRRQIRPGEEGRDRALRLSIRPGTPWPDVATLFDALAKAGFQRVGIVFIGKSALSPPADTNVSRWFQQHPNSVADSSWSKPLAAPSRAFIQCPEVIVPIGASAGESVDPSQRTRMLADLPPTLRKCDCKVDLEAVKAALWAEYGRYENAPTLTHTVLLGTKGAPGVVDVQASGGETWEKAAPRVVAAAAKHLPVVFSVATSP